MEANNPLGQVSTKTLVQFGLTRQPFSDKGSNRYLFEDSAISTQINVIINMLQGSDKIILINGEEGVGKTSLLRRIGKTDHKGLFFCYIKSSEALTVEEICKQALRKMEIPPPSSGTGVLDYFARKIAAKRKIDGKTVLIIDNADELDTYTIDQILRLRNIVSEDGIPAVSIVFSGRPVIEESLKSLPRINNHISVLHNISLYPLSEKQTTDYVLQRIQRASNNPAELFSVSQIKTIYNKSRGIPGLINIEAAILLESIAAKTKGHKEKNTTSDKKGSKLTLIFIVLIILILSASAAYFFIMKNKDSSDSRSSNNTTSSNTVSPLNTTPPLNNTEKTASNIIDTKSSKPYNVESNEDDDKVDTVNNDNELIAKDDNSQEKSDNKKLQEKKEDSPSTNIETENSNITDDNQKPKNKEINKESQKNSEIDTSNNQKNNLDKTPSEENNSKEVSTDETNTNINAKGKRKTDASTKTDKTNTEIKLPQEKQTIPNKIDTKDNKNDSKKTLENGISGVKTEIVKTKVHSEKPYKPNTTEDSKTNQEANTKKANNPQNDKQLTNNPSSNIKTTNTQEKPKTSNKKDAKEDTSAKPKVAYTEDEKWARSQKRGHYTIQFLAAKDLNSIKKFKKTSETFIDAKIIRILRKTKTWYVITLGAFKTNKETREFVLSLPKEIRDQGPWIRSFGSLQDAMIK